MITYTKEELNKFSVETLKELDNEAYNYRLTIVRIKTYKIEMGIK